MSGPGHTAFESRSCITPWPDASQAALHSLQAGCQRVALPGEALQSVAGRQGRGEVYALAAGRSGSDLTLWGQARHQLLIPPLSREILQRRVAQAL